MNKSNPLSLLRMAVPAGLLLASCSNPARQPAPGPENKMPYTLTKPETLACPFGNDWRYLLAAGEEVSPADLQAFIDDHCSSTNKKGMRPLARYTNLYDRAGLRNESVVELHSPRGTMENDINHDSLWLYTTTGITRKLVNDQALPVSTARLITDGNRIVVGYGRSGGAGFKLYDSLLNELQTTPLDFNDAGSVMQLQKSANGYLALVQAWNAQESETFVLMLDNNLHVSLQTSVKGFLGFALALHQDDIYLYGEYLQQPGRPVLLHTRFKGGAVTLFSDSLASTNFFPTVHKAGHHLLFDGLYLVDLYEKKPRVTVIDYGIKHMIGAPMVFRRDALTLDVLVNVSQDTSEQWLRYGLKLSR